MGLDFIRYKGQNLTEVSAEESVLTQVETLADNDLVCGECGKTFQTRKGLENHIETKHPDIN